MRLQAQDAAGHSAFVDRKVSVVDPCVAPAFMCAQDGMCSTCTAAGECACFSTDVSEGPEVLMEYRIIADVVSPQISLKGTGQLSVTERGTLVMVDYIDQGSKYFDPGADCMDDVDGNLTYSISRYGMLSSRISVSLSGQRSVSGPSILLHGTVNLKHGLIRV